MDQDFAISTDDCYTHPTILNNYTQQVDTLCLDFWHNSIQLQRRTREKKQIPDALFLAMQKLLNQTHHFRGLPHASCCGCGASWCTFSTLSSSGLETAKLFRTVMSALVLVMSASRMSCLVLPCHPS
jgi:hypothetical protein